MKKKVLYMIFLLSLVLPLAMAAVSDTSIISVNLVNQDPDPAISGDVVEIRLSVENKGGLAAEDLMVQVIAGYPFSEVSGEGLLKNVGTLAAYQHTDDKQIVKFKLRVDREATAGEYELKIRHYSQGKESVSTQLSLPIDVGSRESAEVIYIDQVELIPGKITPMKFTVNNVGSAPLREMTFQWENAEDIVLPVGSDNTKYIKYINVGGKAELDFKVIASATADPDLYKLDLTLTYEDPITGDEKEIKTKAGVYVGGKTDFDVAFSGSANGEASFSVSNIGSVSASSVTVKIPDQDGWRVRGSNSAIIGNLNEGDYTIASFLLMQASQSVLGERPNRGLRDISSGAEVASSSDEVVMLEIVYTDSRGNRHTLEKQVSVDVASLRSQTGGVAKSGSGGDQTFGRSGAQQSSFATLVSAGKWIILIGVLSVIFFVGRKKYNVARLKDPGYTFKRLVKDLVNRTKK